MSINWSPSEQEIINKQKLGDLRPSYYSVTNRNYIQVDEDFEGFLILQDQEQKQKLLSWISKVTKIENDNKDRDVILKTFNGIRITDTGARIEELDKRLNEYAEMYANLLSEGDDPSKYVTVLELNLMIRSISRCVDNISIQREQAFHEQNLTALMGAKIAEESITEDTQKELTSWQAVLSTYKGQKAKSNKNRSGASKLGGLL